MFLIMFLNNLAIAYLWVGILCTEYTFVEIESNLSIPTGKKNSPFFILFLGVILLICECFEMVV